MNIGGVTNLGRRIKVKKFEKYELSSKLLPNNKNDDRLPVLQDPGFCCSQEFQCLQPPPIDLWLQYYCTNMTNLAIINHHKICHCCPITLVVSHHWSCQTLNSSHLSSLELPDPLGVSSIASWQSGLAQLGCLIHFFAQEWIHKHPHTNDWIKNTKCGLEILGGAWECKLRSFQKMYTWQLKHGSSKNWTWPNSGH